MLAPDVVVYPRGIDLEQVKGMDVILAVDAARRRTHVHRRAAPDRWGSIEIGSDREPLTHPALPGMSVRLGAV